MKRFVENKTNFQEMLRSKKKKVKDKDVKVDHNYLKLFPIYMIK